MLTEAEKRDILEEMEALPERRAACIGALNVVQRHRRWVSDESVRDIAEFLEMTPDEVDNVATFYNLIFRRPVGRHVILLCNSATCWMLGYESLLDWLKRRLEIELGQTTSDDRFTLLPVVCLGACDRAPALMIDEDLHGPVEADTLEALLEQYP
ncbi:MAG TPA: NADH-quinone oxidoreductase subunit NuoE [Candidatus Sumerlaeota bacterium]|nr:NADH-quinone oxidoreductase subunit NuoE [Candidatus Sumerlaeota bacterium]